MLEHRALVDRALVGDLAAIDRQWRVEQDRARDSRRGARRAGQELRRAAREMPAGSVGSAAAAARLSAGSVGLMRRQPSRSSITSADNSSRLMPAMTTSRTSGAQAATKRARSGPTLTQVPLRELEILGDAAVEIEAGIEVVGIGRFERVAELVKAFLVEGVRGQLRLAPIARRDVRPLGANFHLAVVRHSLASLPDTGSPTWPERLVRGLHRHEERRGLGGAEAGQHRHALAGFLHREFVEAVPDERRQRRAREEHRVQPVEEFRAQRLVVAQIRQQRFVALRYVEIDRRRNLAGDCARSPRCRQASACRRRDTSSRRCRASARYCGCRQRCDSTAASR